jgi:hypothetical protein
MSRFQRAGGGRGLGWVAVLAVAVWAAGGGRAWAQEAKPAEAQAKLPKADEVLDQAIEALGGKAAIEKIHSRVVKGTLAIEAQDIRGSITIYAAAPNKRYMLVELPGAGKSEEGADGDVCWRINAMGPSVLEGEQRAAYKRQSMFNSELNWKKLYAKVECVGEETIDGHPCYKIVKTPPEGEGNPETAYYDCKTHLPVRAVLSYKGPMGPMTVEITPSEFKKVDGVLLAHKLTQKSLNLNHTAVLTFDSIENNVDIPADRFAPPDAVKALLAEGRTETKPPGAEKHTPEKPEKPEKP